MRACIVSLNPGYCHVQAEEGGTERIFVHSSACSTFSLRQAAVGDVLDIGDIEMTAKGARARRASWVERPAA
jgi:hypothetical protein